MPFYAELKPVRLALAKLANHQLTWEAIGLLMPRRGLDFFAPRMDEEAIKEGGRDAVVKLRQYVRPDSVVLDLGCGLGRVAKSLAPLCRTLYAADASSAYCMRARSYLEGQSNVHVVKIDGNSLQNFPDCSLDFVYSWEVLVHAKRQVVEKYLREVRRVLKPGGVFLFHLPEPEISFPPFEWYAREDLEALLDSSPLTLESRVDGRDEITLVMRRVR